MKISVKVEYVGSKPLPHVKLKMDRRLFVTTYLFPTKEVFDARYEGALDISNLNYSIVFQDHEETMARVTTLHGTYEYYCLHLNGNLFFYAESLRFLICKESRV